MTLGTRFRIELACLREDTVQTKSEQPQDKWVAVMSAPFENATFIFALKPSRAYGDPILGENTR